MHLQEKLRSLIEASPTVSLNFLALFVVIPETNDSRLQVFHGANRTRTGDLLGAIPAVFASEFGLVERFLGLRSRSPNIFPNTLHRVLQELPLGASQTDVVE